ncbi:uncharacterized protein YutE (UPF0331/DUF86 family) [Melghirimyces profundicolus]|uniref:Uncharacterized protein YutE (UPF0331/DUF86 family) n=1 Tax=Melghirimyces profundicolus TaxID=1242148 RepID=A0A2T6BSN5_9BACL|nr:DUF86 domain-containing protein [Melghirimyces profundicolus]PTX59083.1 uncharacterized protein YutE (UPF0331/DUF86 family) [Melghirimyces profundicolus]
MIYEVDTERIKSQLEYLERCLDVMFDAREAWSRDDRLACFAGARALHIGVECVIDVGSTMIDGFIMRDPGGYLDIVDILEDENVVPSYGAVRLKELIRFRDRLVRRYHEVSEEELFRELSDTEVFHSYITWVRDYLKQELGSAYPGPKGEER